jgi:hypothetical protein
MLADWRELGVVGTGVLVAVTVALWVVHALDNHAD